MRGSFLFLILLLTAVVLLSACTRVVNEPADELRMYSWSGESENGTAVRLSFDDSSGYLSVSSAGDTLEIGGLCVYTDDSLMICDSKTGMHYSFGYRLYGDRIELSRDGGVLTLKKEESSE